jgi:hypothetical protein
VKLKKGCIQVSQNRFYRITILILPLLFLNIVILQAGIHAPKGEENKIKLKIKGKERTYYELDKNGLNYKGVGKKFEMGDSIRIGIYSRSIKAQTGKKIRNYGFTIQIDNGKPQKLKYKKSGSNVTSVDRPGWNYTQSGVWFMYLPVKEKGYKIKVEPLKGNPVVYVRISSKELEKEGEFGVGLKTVNWQDRWRIETKSDKGAKIKLWYPLKKTKQLQYEIKGPASVKVFTRIEFDNGNLKDDYYVRIREDGFDLGTYFFKTEKSEKSSIIKTGKTVGKWRSVWLNIPRGKHYYTFTLPNIEDNSDKTVYIRLKEWPED